jgi:MerR family transcriptional regulator, copper efflux regulator
MPRPSAASVPGDQGAMDSMDRTRSDVELADARRRGWLSIKQAAEAARVSAKMIRHYEQVGLLGKARRTTAGYRIYDETDVQTLRFVRRARDLGFSIKEISDLLALWQDRERSSPDVAKMAQEHISQLDSRINELQVIRRSLQHLSDKAQGDERPEHPVLEDHTAEA